MEQSQGTGRKFFPGWQSAAASRIIKTVIGFMRKEQSGCRRPMKPHRCRSTAGLVKEALDRQKPVFLICSRQKLPAILLYLLVPLLLPTSGILLPSALFCSDSPVQVLYPLLLSLPGRTATGETLLVRHDGASVLFLNELRFRKEFRPVLETAAERAALPAVRAVQGERGTLEGIDYRGTAVLAAVTRFRTVPGFWWQK